MNVGTPFPKGGEYVIGYFIYVLYSNKMSLASPVFALIEDSMDNSVW